MKRLFLIFTVAVVALFYGCAETDAEGTPKFEFTNGGEAYFELPSSGGSVAANFSSPSSWWTESTSGWITVTPQFGEAGKGLVVLTVLPNNSEDERVGKVLIKLSDEEFYEISVLQRGKEIFESTSLERYDIGLSGGEIYIKITSNVDYTVDIPVSAQSWLELVDTRVTQESAIRLKVAPSDSYNTRETVVSLRDKQQNLLESFVVSQSCIIGDIITFDKDWDTKGIVFYVDDSVIKVVSVREMTDKAWATYDVFEDITMARDKDDGTKNMAKIKEIDPSLVKHPAFGWCANYDEGWYLPAINELVEIHKNITHINAILDVNGYTKFVFNSPYISSTEYSYDTKLAMCCHYSDGSTFSYSKVAKTVKIRAVLTIRKQTDSDTDKVE